MATRVLLCLSLACLVLATFRVNPIPHVDVLALGLALYVGSAVVGTHRQ